MKEIQINEVVDHKPKDIFIADLFRKEIMSGRLKKGDKLLPDEKIARKYKLNKRTVASGLKTLVDDGLLSRAPRRGTIVIKDYSDNDNVTGDSDNSAPNKYDVPSPYGMEDLFFIPETKVLTFASFETHPKQKGMWEHLIAEFNSKSKGRKVELKLIKPEHFSEDGAVLQRNMSTGNKSPDIIQCLLCNALPSGLADLPDDLIKYTSGEESLSANVMPDFKGLLKKIVPVYFSVPVCVWNQEMAKDFGIEFLKDSILKGNLVETLCASYSKLPGSLEKIGPHLNNLLRHYGLPVSPNSVSKNHFWEFFDEIFKELKKVKKQEHKRIFIEAPGYKSFYNFSRKKHFLIETLSTPPYYPDKEYVEFKLGSSFYPPKNDLFMELSSLGIAKDSEEPEFAADFLRFVASHESQLFMHSCVNGIPYRQSALDALPEIDPQISRLEIALIRDKIKFAYYSWQRYFNSNVISVEMIGLFENIISGNIASSSEAADIAYKIFTKQLKQKEML